MKKLMKISVASALGLALAIPACAQNAAQSDRIVGATGSVGTQSSTTSASTQGGMLIGSLGAKTTAGSVAALVIVSGAEAVSSTGHTK